MTRTVSGSRSERYCSYFSDYFGSCLSYDTRDVPYRRTVTENRLPDGVAAPADLFESLQDRYFQLLEERRKAEQTLASSQRDEILADNADGFQRLGASLWLIGGFLAIMFLFLVIAIERHRRALVASLSPMRAPADSTE